MFPWPSTAIKEDSEGWCGLVPQVRLRVPFAFLDMKMTHIHYAVTAFVTVYPARSSDLIIDFSLLFIDLS